MAGMPLTAVYETVEDGWTQARLVELPGVITAAPTLAEARELLTDALLAYVGSFSTPAPPAAPGATSETLELTIT